MAKKNVKRQRAANGDRVTLEAVKRELNAVIDGLKALKPTQSKVEQLDIDLKVIAVAGMIKQCEFMCPARVGLLSFKPFLRKTKSMKR